MRCLLDLDECLVDFVGGAAALFHKDPAAITAWDIPPQWGLTPEQFYAALGFTFWAGLRPLPWAGDVLALVERAFGGPENVCLLSSPCRTEGCAEGKVAWVTRNLPAYSRRFLLGPAKHFCASPTSVLVDDYEGNVDAFRDAGGHYCLFARPWNRARQHAADPVAFLKAQLTDLLGDF